MVEVQVGRACKGTYRGQAAVGDQRQCAGNYLNEKRNLQGGQPSLRGSIYDAKKWHLNPSALSNGRKARSALRGHVVEAVRFGPWVRRGVAPICVGRARYPPGSPDPCRETQYFNSGAAKDEVLVDFLREGYNCARTA